MVGPLVHLSQTSDCSEALVARMTLASALIALGRGPARCAELSLAPALGLPSLVLKGFCRALLMDGLLVVVNPPLLDA